MNIKLTKSIARALLIISFLTLTNNDPSLVEASKNRKYSIHYDNKIMANNTSIDKRQKGEESQLFLNLEKYKFSSRNYEISFPKEKHLLLSTKNSAKFYYNNFMITTNIITSKVKLNDSNKSNNMEKLKLTAINLQDYSGYKVVTSSYVEKSRNLPKYYYYELKNKNDIVTFRNVTIMALIPLKDTISNNDYLMVSLNSNARNILEAQKTFNKIFSTIKLNKNKLSKYKVRKRILNNNALKYKISIPKAFYAHTKNSDRLVVLKPIADSTKNNTDEITIRKFISNKYSEFSKCDKKHFEIKANTFIKNLTKYSKNQKIENHSTKTINKTNALIFKTIESNSKNYITTLNCYIFYDNFGYVIKYTSSNLKQNSKNLTEIYNCFSSFENYSKLE